MSKPGDPPDFNLALSRKNDDGTYTACGTIGAGWYGASNSLYIKLNAGVSFSWRDQEGGYQLRLFPAKPREPKEQRGADESS